MRACTGKLNKSSERTEQALALRGEEATGPHATAAMHSTEGRC